MTRWTPRQARQLGPFACPPIAWTLANTLTLRRLVKALADHVAILDLVTQAVEIDLEQKAAR